MAVAPASMADRIIILDDEEESPQPSCSNTRSSSRTAKPQQPAPTHITRSPKLQQPAPTHITRSPFATAKKDSHVLQAENQKLFAEFVEYCSALTQDCPEVLSFLHTKHSKACPDFLSSVEFRNSLGRCLTRAQANRSKAFVYIQELCTILRQHGAKRRQSLVKVEISAPTSASTSTSSPFSTVSLKRKDKSKVKAGEEDVGVKEEGLDEEQPSTSGLQEDKDEKSTAEQEEKKTHRASKKQIAYLENLLKVYNEEIRRLQEKDMSLDDLEAEDSGYIQEHRLKRKMIKIYEKLCDLKGCGTSTGRVIEQRIIYKSTRYPEINKKIERFINSPEAHRNPPDYPDILQQVQRANQRYNLCLSRKQITQMAQEAFRETGSQLQERRHLDMVYNFGSHLTDPYKPALDPALSDASLHRKLRSNREVALSSLEKVITKYAVKQDDTEERERNKRLEKKEGHKSEKEGEGAKEVNGVVVEEEEEEEEEGGGDDDEEDESSDPDIEEEIQASAQQAGPDDEEEEEDSNEAEQAKDDRTKQEQEQGTNQEQGTEVSGTGSGEEGGSDHNPGIPPLSDDPCPRDSPSQSEAAQPENETQSHNGDAAANGEAVDSSDHVPAALVSTSTLTQDLSPAAANQVSLPPSPVVVFEHTDKRNTQTETTNGESQPPSPPTVVTTRSRKRKREEITLLNSHTVIDDSEVDPPLDMAVITDSPAQQVESSRADTPTQDLVTSSQSTPPPKKNKVNVATQCDPDEVIVLSDSE